MKTLSISGLFCILMFSCQQAPQTQDQSENESVEKESASASRHVAWSQDATIYEVNVRQHTEEGTFKAFEEDLPRLKELGVKILWLMPIQPIGVKNRKGGLGSYYSIKDYTAVNPEFGSMEDFKQLVNRAHELGFKVILDWVANHTAWDHQWITDHPDWYTRNESGDIVSPVDDWSDVADLNYDSEEMRNSMMEALKFWVRETDIDGYRCDVGMMVPMDFWDRSRKELDAIKPVFMLAEAEGPEFHKNAFDMTYGWEFHHLMNEVAKGAQPASILSEHITKIDTTYPADAYRMFFTTNHDENSWNGTVYERMKGNHKNFFVLATTMKYGMPLIYSGQEAGLSKRLAFFEKDTIDWSDTGLFAFYAQMTQLKRTHPALVNGEGQGDFKEITAEDGLYAYTRSKGDRSLAVLLNLSDTTAAEFNMDLLPTGAAMDVMTSSEISRHEVLRIEPNQFAIIDIE